MRLTLISLSSSMILIFLPSIEMMRSLTKFDKVRIAFEVVILEKLAKSSRAK